MEEQTGMVRLAAVQAAPVFLNREATVEKACILIAEAAANGARIIGFPECFIPGFPHWFHFSSAEGPESKMFFKELFKNSVVIPSPATDALCEAAKKADAYVVMGINERDAWSMGTLYNSQLFIGRDGRIMGKHRKIMPTKYERLVHGAGDGSTMKAFKTEYGELGGLICGENTNSLARFALIAQYEKFHVAAWPAFATRATQPVLGHIDLRSRYHAYEAGNFVINATGVFSEEMKDMLCRNEGDRAEITGDGGHSSIIGPTGNFLAGPAGPGEQIIYADATMEAMTEAKMKHDIIGHYNRFDIFRFYVNDEELAPMRWGNPER